MKTALTLFFTLFIFAQGAWADLPQPDSFTIGLPLPSNLATPIWMDAPRASANEENVPTLTIPIQAQNSCSYLLLTLLFNDKSKSPICVTWIDNTGARFTLSEDLSEGIDMPNQRSLLIPATTIGLGGSIEIEGDENVTSVQLEWLSKGDAIAGSKVVDTIVAPNYRPTTTADQMAAATPKSPQIQWDKAVVESVIVSTPEHIEQPTAFHLTLDSIPTSSRLRLQINGLDLSHHLLIWLNGQVAAILSPETPDLNDPGYSPNSPSTYIGWRSGSALLDSSLFKVGDNALQITVETAADTTPATVPLAIKNMAIQFRFPPNDNSLKTTPASSLNQTNDLVPAAQFPGQN